MKSMPVTLIFACIVIALYAVGSQMEHEAQRIEASR